MWLGWGGIHVAGFSLLHGYHPNTATPKFQHTSKQKHTTNVVITIEKSQAPDDGVLMFETC